MMAMVAAGSQLYTRFNPQDGSSGFPVWRSGDGGRTWTKPSAPLSFLIDSFVQFGRANSGAPGGYVYALENRTTGIFLVRAPAASVQTNSAYQYFSGTTTAPAWSSRRADAKSIFTDPAGIRDQASPTCPASTATCWRRRIPRMNGCQAIGSGSSRRPSRRGHGAR